MSSSVEGGAAIDFVDLLDRVRAIASTGLHYTDGVYDRERYAQLLELAAEGYRTGTDRELAGVTEVWRAESGYTTPKIGVAAAVFDDADRLLVVRRSDDHAWGLLSGWVEVGEHPGQGLRREAVEEIGCEIELGSLAVVHHRRASAGFGPHAVVTLVYLAELSEGRPGTSHEVLESAFLDIEQIAPWHLDHAELAAAARRVWLGGAPETAPSL